MLLTDMELMTAGKHHCALRNARAIESAVLAKLREQKPVAVRLSNGTISITGQAIVPLGTQLYLNPAPIPEGWQLVPVEPTIEMLEELSALNLGVSQFHDAVADRYRRMLAAARSE